MFKIHLLVKIISKNKNNNKYNFEVLAKVAFIFNFSPSSEKNLYTKI